jgi:hypothetical protein
VDSVRRVPRRPLSILASLAALITLDITSGCRGAPNAVLTDVTEARRLAGNLRAQFNKASNASDRAVMADTDEASVAFAHQAEQIKGLVKADTTALVPILRRLGTPIAVKELDSFGDSFSAYDKLDVSILELAVENTNLKAQRLSFGPAHDAADTLREALDALVVAAPAKDRCRLDALVAKAVVSVREIQVLQAPHIAEASDDAMSRLEKKMDLLSAAAKDAVRALGGLVDAAGRAKLAAAAAALDQFDGFSRQIVKLSRRNSNVRSLELSLRQKPLASAQCDAFLNTLQDALAKDPFSATR